MEKKKQIYNLSPNEILANFNSSLEGLTDEEAEKRIKIHGLNKIEKKINWKWARLIINQFKDALVWILLVAAFLAFLFGETHDTIIIFFIVLINASIGFFQEFKTERILENIKKIVTDKASVFRNGVKKEINSKFLVPGDIVFVSTGDNIPADGYILESYNFKVNSYIFTGESKPEKKSEKILEKEDVLLADIDNMVFMGEEVAVGEAKFLVTEIGAKTELGKIAKLTYEIREDLTPMQKKMQKLGKNVTTLAVFIGILVMITGQFFDMSWYDNFIFALALAVSIVPEGLPAAISVALSLGMKRLLKKNVLAKKLSAVETLGSVSIICVDKTGTITKNELTVVKIILNEEIIDVGGEGYLPKGNFSKNGKLVNSIEIKNLDLILKIGALCNDASLLEENGIYKILGDPTEGAIVVAGKKYNPKEGFYEQGEKKITENPFTSERMRMSVVYENNKTVSFVKGSPDVMLDLCNRKIVNDKISELTKKDKIKIKNVYNQMSNEALRVLAFAYRDLDKISKNKYQEEAEKDLVWVGMMAMIDPPRAGVYKSIEECRNLGIRVIMITGDYEVTARAIAQRIGLIQKKTNENVISGKELNSLKDEEIYQKIEKGVCIFARIAPEQKLRIASILKKNQEIIAMTGDGVNDAPALKRADIGVAMGIMGTDVSKEASDMVILDDNFASIVEGVKEGKTIFRNLRKFVHYVFTSNAGELFTVVGGVLFGIPSPLTAIQILATDLGTDVLPSFSLSLEPSEPRAKKTKFINEKKEIITFRGFRRIIYLGIIMAFGALTAFFWSMKRGGWNFGEEIIKDSFLYTKSTTSAYAVIAMAQMANLLQSRSKKISPFKLGFFKNKYAIGAMAVSVSILFGFMYLPFCQKYLHMLPIDGKDWLMVLISFVAVFVFEEMRKKFKIKG